MQVKFSEEEFGKLKEKLRIYEWAQRTLLTKIDILHESLRTVDGSPIESIKGRIKSPESIADKLYRLSVEVTAESAQKNLRDIAGVRVICSFSKDILYLVGLLRQMPGMKILDEKDYVTRPKPSGYRSYHVIMELPVFYSGKAEDVVVEVQIRTEAMNFWSTLEHKAKYKYKNRVPKHLSDELVMCADKIAELDNRMFLIHEIIALINRDIGSK
ncbi:MAG: GTP pyrophosphokinase family protein [Oscillospiraceae bacterium]|nr:GTP pyrophosphokinase family protein [Oscillospiraceae bacterium]